MHIDENNVVHFDAAEAAGLQAEVDGELLAAACWQVVSICDRMIAELERS